MNTPGDPVDPEHPAAEASAIPGANPAVEPFAPPSESAPFPIVGIGASAGGIEALRAFFHSLPADTGMAFVVVLHLYPDHESHLPEILARATKMPVQEASNNEPVQPDRVYVIPPGKTLVLGERLLQLAPRTHAGGVHRPVDHFLRSLAEEMGHKAIGVVFSGSGDDGTLGMEEVKAGGGITFAQDDTAEHTAMPRSAAAAGCVDFVLPPRDIAREIARIAVHPLLEPSAEELAGEQSVADVLQLLRRATGVDFANYKPNTLRRRITRRMLLHKLDGLPDYVAMLGSNPGELDALYSDILISVTSFFRDPESYETLKKTVFPQLAGERSRHEPVRVWALGCSTGEEAFSLAMTFTEYIESTGKRTAMQVFATDLNGAGIEKARTGLYSKGIVQDVSPERLRRFFVEVDGSYRIAKPIRDMCVFARQNVLADPPFSRMDLVACRNLLIYLEPVLQKQLIPILHYALRSPGYLWLGGSETIGSYHDLFELRDARHKIYLRKGAGRPALALGADLPRGATNRQIPRAEVREGSTSRFDPEREADRVLLASYAPPGVLIDDALEIVQFRGDTGPFLAPSPGRASLSLLKMLREGLLVGVRGAVHRARREGVPVREEGLRVRSNGGYREVNVAVVPLSGGPATEVRSLVLFEEPLKTPDANPRPSAALDDSLEQPSPGVAGEEPAEREFARVKQELAATRDYLQSLIEQQEVANDGLQSANEDVQSANEELQSANEELQSTNEELETSKEEIQASNEELAIVNSELQTRNAQLAESNDDLTNLIGSAQMAIVILGRDLRVRRVTPLAERVLDLSAADIGRPAREIGDRLDVSDLEGMIAAAVDTTISPRDREVRGRDGRWYSLRARPYRTHENRVDGAVLVLVDVDDLKRAEEALRESEARFRLLADSAPVLMWVNGLGGCEMVNRAYESFVGVTEPDVQSFEWTRFVHPDDRAAYLAAYLDAFTRRGLFEAELRLRRADGVYRWMRSVGQPRFLAGGEFVGYVGCTYDVNELREAQESLKALDRNKDVFLGVLAHELRNPLGAIRNASYVLGLPGAGREVISNAQAVIDRQTRHMTRLVDDLLDISRITQGKIRLALETLSLGDAVAGVVNATEHYRRERRQELILALPEEPVHVRADAARIDQILGNLFINAAKFTPADGHVWVSVERESANTAVIRVRDDGEGIATELLPRIFDLFVQGDVSAADFGSAGIGLALAKQLVVLHGGTIEARSAGALKGSEFVVRLPVAEPARRRTARAARSRHRPRRFRPTRVDRRRQSRFRSNAGRAASARGPRRPRHRRWRERTRRGGRVRTRRRLARPRVGGGRRRVHRRREAAPREPGDPRNRGGQRDGPAAGLRAQPSGGLRRSPHEAGRCATAAAAGRRGAEPVAGG